MTFTKLVKAPAKDLPGLHRFPMAVDALQEATAWTLSQGVQWMDFYFFTDFYKGLKLKLIKE